MRQSGLYRQKMDRDDYLAAHNHHLALQGVRETYTRSRNGPGGKREEDRQREPKEAGRAGGKGSNLM